MKKTILFLFLLLGLIVLSACGGSQETAPTENNPSQTSGAAMGSVETGQCTVQSKAVADEAVPGDHITGMKENYSITITNYSDFSCKGCATIAAALAKAMELYPDDIRLIFRHYTSPAKNPLVVARAIESAGNQGNYVGMYQLFYNDTQAWVDLGEEALNNYIWERVTTLELDEEQFFSDISSDETAALVQNQYAQALSFLNLLSLDIHADRIAAGAEAAGQQNRFWEMYQLLLSDQASWQEMDDPNFDQYLIELASQLKLDASQFSQDFDNLTGADDSALPLDRALSYFGFFYRIPLGMAAAKAAEAAGVQGKFWEMHDMLFANQSIWAKMNEQEFLFFLTTQFETMGIDPEKFNQDYYSPEIDERILQDYLDVRTTNANAPVVYVNGSITPIYITTIGDFLIWLDSLMIPFGRHIRDTQIYECPPLTIDPESQYTATLRTTKGDIVVALYPEAAPFAVNNFVYLAEQDYYDNTPFYAVVEGFVAQTGDPSGTGWGNPGFLYEIETSDLTFERPFMVAMANSGPGTNNSQFFFNFSSLSYLNGKYTIFGEVIDGVDVLKSLKFRDPEADPYASLDEFILDITIEQK